MARLNFLLVGETVALEMSEARARRIVQSILSLWEICAYKSLSFNFLRVSFKLGGLCNAGINP